MAGLILALLYGIYFREYTNLFKKTIITTGAGRRDHEGRKRGEVTGNR